MRIMYNTCFRCGEETFADYCEFCEPGGVNEERRPIQKEIDYYEEIDYLEDLAAQYNDTSSERG